MSENKAVTKAAGIIGVFTIISRILGLVRDIVIANYFGAKFCSDAFFAAFRIPNLLRRLFAEGSLSISFIPVFTEYLNTSGRDEAFKMARSALKLLSVILAIVTLSGMLFSPQIASVLGYGFESPEKVILTAKLTRIMFPYIFFISLVALSMGILNVLGHFSAPAMAPIFLNVSMISSVYIVSLFTADNVQRITGLAFGVLVGGFLQLALQLPFLVRKGFYFWEKAGMYHPGLRKVGKLMIPAIFGAAAYQINILVGIILASTLNEGSITYLYFADRLVQFPLGIFAISTATALLPSLSKQAATKDYSSLKDTFSYSMRQIFFITLPSMAGLIALREPIVRLLFERGAFGHEAALLTADALLCFSVGLWAFAGVRIVIAVFNAFSDTKTPAVIAFVSIVLNILFSIFFMQYIGHLGLALATSLSAIIHILLLSFKLNEKLEGINWIEIVFSFFKSFAASILMCGTVILVRNYIIPEKIISITGYFFCLVVCILTGVCVYFFVSLIFKSTELETFWLIIKEEIFKK